MSTSANAVDSSSTISPSMSARIRIKKDKYGQSQVRYSTATY
jgi:hypothetical protein